MTPTTPDRARGAAAVIPVPAQTTAAATPVRRRGKPSGAVPRSAEGDGLPLPAAAADVAEGGPDDPGVRVGGETSRTPGSTPGTAFPRSPVAVSGPRTWVLELPAGTPILTANHRKHRLAANDRTQALKGIAIQLARQARLPVIERADILTEYFPPPRLRSKRHPLASERVEDGDALAPTCKALVDGWVLAGVFPRDTKKCLRRHAYEVKPQTHPRGLLRITITEVTGDDG